MMAGMGAWIIEMLFQSACGWIGHHLLRIVTFGRVAPDWGDGSESSVAEWVGLMALAATLSVVGWLSLT
jgi:hypothetical protein